MKVVWRRQDMNSLRMPTVCAVTGQPAAGQSGVWFGKQWARFVPAVFRIAVNLAHRPVVVQVPMSQPVLARHTRRRRLSLLSLVCVIAALAAAIVLRDAAGGLLFFLLLAAAIGWMFFLTIGQNKVGADVEGDWIVMNRAAPQFAQALARANPPGMVQIVADPSPRVVSRELG